MHTNAREWVECQVQGLHWMTKLTLEHSRWWNPTVKQDMLFCWLWRSPAVAFAEVNHLRNVNFMAVTMEAGSGGDRG